MRLAKLIAISGQASRRQAEQLILDGKVNVNNQIVRSILTFVTTGDVIHVNGVNISTWLSNDFTMQQTKLWLYYKPRGVITSRKDSYSRTTIFSLLPYDMQNILTVGRLDYNTEGLILLTNNGRLSRFFELPQHNIKRVYRCKIFGAKINDKQMIQARNSLNIDGIQYRSVIVQPDDQQHNITKAKFNQWFKVTLSEGKNREIRHIFEYFGATVSRLIRIRYGEFSLASMIPQQIIPVANKLLLKYTKKISNDQ